LKKYLFRFLVRKSNYIITHARDGLECYRKYSKTTRKSASHGVIGEHIRYFPHPLVKRFISQGKKPEIDALIWGSIIPYKGIDVFLKYLYDNDLQE
jgi:hypothetical protein